MSTDAPSLLPVPKQRKLGMNPPTAINRARCLHLSDYAPMKALPAPSVTTAGVGGNPQLFRNRYVDTNLFGNDTLGDCVIAARAHAMLCWAGVSGNPVQVTTQECTTTYFRLTGGADNGLDIMTALNDWMRTPFAAGNTLIGYLAIDPTNQVQIKQGIQFFGNVTFGVNLPTAWQDATAWTLGPGGTTLGKWAPGSLGGHCVSAIDFGPENVWVNTWGEKMPFAWEAVPVYASEAYVLLDALWISRLTQTSIEGLNLAALKADLALFKASLGIAA